MRLQGRRKPIVADDTARAEFVAADMLAQAEHGEDASAILITTSVNRSRMKSRAKWSASWKHFRDARSPRHH